DSLRGGATQLVNTNKLVRFYNGATGLKTGTTNDAGSCLSASAERDGLKLIAVVMGAKTSEDRFNSAKSLLDYGYSKYEMAEIPSIGEEYKKIKVLHGESEDVDLFFNVSGNVLVPKGKNNSIVTEIQISNNIEAPVLKGQTVGKITVKIGDEVISTHDIITERSVEKMDIYKGFGFLLKSLFKN
ncbi:MAG: D-alanyl-D-alanine carboxypeptidase family protein, partial [Oscillospiraceae bacterium]